MLFPCFYSLAPQFAISVAFFHEPYNHFVSMDLQLEIDIHFDALIEVLSCYWFWCSRWSMQVLVLKMVYAGFAKLVSMQVCFWILRFYFLCFYLRVLQQYTEFISGSQLQLEVRIVGLFFFLLITR